MGLDNRAFPLIARVLMALLFLVAGVRKLLAYGATVGYFAKIGLPMPDILVGVVLTVEIGGAILLVAGWKQTIVAAVLALFTLATALAAHKFWVESDPQAYSGQLYNFLKNVAIAGGLLMVMIDGRTVRR